jgi:hypothetical protein
MYSIDSGATWGQTTLPLATGDAFHSDPTVDWTSNGTAWSTTIGINSTGTTLKIRAYLSTDGGATWALDNTFSGAQTTFVSTTVNLDAACNLVTGGTGGCAGQTLHIAFTSITDCSVTDNGWFLDNVQVTACVP